MHGQVSSLLETLVGRLPVANETPRTRRAAPIPLTPFPLRRKRGRQLRWAGDDGLPPRQVAERTTPASVRAEPHSFPLWGEGGAQRRIGAASGAPPPQCSERNTALARRRWQELPPLS